MNIQLIDQFDRNEKYRGKKTINQIIPILNNNTIEYDISINCYS